jgi:acid phosphatase family membrane protein YuiD
MMDFFTDMGKEMPVEEKLKEFVGHTPLQVCMGAILGVIIGFAVCAIMV